MKYTLQDTLDNLLTSFKIATAVGLHIVRGNAKDYDNGDTNVIASIHDPILPYLL